MRSRRVVGHFDSDGSVAIRENFQQFVDLASSTRVRSGSTRSYRLPMDIPRASGSLSFPNPRFISGFLQASRNYPVPDSRFGKDAGFVQGLGLSTLSSSTSSRDGAAERYSFGRARHAS